jgi:translation initiation factor IF-1
VSCQDAIKLEGIVVEAFSSRLYQVQLSNGHRLLGHMVRGARRGVRDSESSTPPLVQRSAFQVGDTVTLEMSPFDFSKGRILLENNL